MDRLPQHAEALAHDGDALSVAALLRARRWRTVVRGQTVSAEKGYLKETGNLLFHVALVGVLVGAALGSWYGWHASRLLVAGPDGAFCNTVQQYDDYGLGARVSAGSLARFCLELTDFQASYLDSGQPSSFAASVTASGPAVGGVGRSARFSVNSPLRLSGANVYLLGHGYAPMLRYTDRTGRTQTAVAPFLPNDSTFTSEGVAAFPDVNGRDRSLQVAFQGIYLPTAPSSPPYVRSQYPAEKSPALMLFFYRGDLGLDAGIPQSVYELNQRQIRAGRLAQVGEPKLLRPGESWILDDGTRVEFLGTRQWVSLSIRYDPGGQIVLGSVVVMLAGLLLTLSGKRRRVWFRVAPSTTSGSSVVEAGGLPRADYPGFADEFQSLVREIDNVRAV
jgi:cytochrome c biogenesis protein